MQEPIAERHGYQNTFKILIVYVEKNISIFSPRAFIRTVYNSFYLYILINDV